ncbi:hypothetical protein ACHHYP_12299 [Achlya hypogyna]|uniref:PX domain-containing protein n=1 Tax=Achlya hypogyna TaxID=1202772 RepID=A0A1V9YH70_ACHHY|nr:hypothetical protein ACHHYP_12299 [Achlya hypogyna]
MPTTLHHGHSPFWHSSSALSRLSTTRVEITGSHIRLSANETKTTEDSVVFKLRVYHGTSTVYELEKSYRAFTALKADLLQALDAGHLCTGVCPWLWEDLQHNFERPKSRTNLRAWLQIRLHRHTPATAVVFTAHFQELLDSLLQLLRKEHAKCQKLTDLSDVLATFLELTDTTEDNASGLVRISDRMAISRASI